MLPFCPNCGTLLIPKRHGARRALKCKHCNYTQVMPIKDRPVGIFWDYENVPLRKRDGKKLLQGLYHFSKAYDVQYAKVYTRQSTISDNAVKAIQDLKFFKLKFITKNGHNAVDNSMINSCKNILQKHHLPLLIFITGDSDFLRLIKRLLKIFSHEMLLISQAKSTSGKLHNFVIKNFTVSEISDNIEGWWKTIS